jgi:hypothetical protein
MKDPRFVPSAIERGPYCGAYSFPRPRKAGFILAFEIRCRCQVADNLPIIRWSHAA